MNLQVPRLAQGSDIDNRCPLPKAKDTALTAQTQLWCEYNSWGFCSECQRLQPRDLILQGLEGLSRPDKLLKKCVFCSATKAVPKVVHPPTELDQLAPEVLEALCPLQVKYGPWMQAKDRFGRGNGYRLHGGMLNFGPDIPPWAFTLFASPGFTWTTARVKALQQSLLDDLEAQEDPVPNVAPQIRQTK